MEVGGASRRLPHCPVAYTSDGRIAYALGKQLVVENKVVLTADGGVTYAHFGDDGSIVIVVDGKRVERWRRGAQVFARDLPAALEGKTPILRADNCGAWPGTRPTHRS